VSGATSNAATPLAGSGTRGTASAATTAGDAPRSTEATLTRLRQVMDRVRGGYARDLSGAEAAPREGEYLVPVGTVMAAVLDMEINSDWEGRWRAMITRDVHDLGQDVILIPKGTRVLGTSVRPKPVNEAINERMALVAQWLVLPNGARIDLNRSTMLDGAGVAALEGDVNRHFLATLGGVVAYGVIGGWGAAQAAKAALRPPPMAP
jgi:type IV secretory pathway VirB10-like protein